MCLRGRCLCSLHAHSTLLLQQRSSLRPSPSLAKQCSVHRADVSYHSNGFPSFLSSHSVVCQVSVSFRLQSLFTAMGVAFNLGAFDFTAAAALTYASQSLTFDCLGANRFIPSGYTVQGATQLFGLFAVNVNFQIQPKGQDGDFYITITSQIQVHRFLHLVFFKCYGCVERATQPLQNGSRQFITCSLLSASQITPSP